jgi:hypothetical protein
MRYFRSSEKISLLSINGAMSFQYKTFPFGTKGKRDDCHFYRDKSFLSQIKVLVSPHPAYLTKTLICSIAQIGLSQK